MKEEKNKKIELTQDSFDSLKNELDDLVENKLPAVVDRIAKAREQGDLSENSEYKDAKDQQELLEVRIGEIQEILSQAKIIKETTDVTKVGVGSTVTVTDDRGRTLVYVMVGEFDKAAVENNTISIVSPIGQALHHKKVGHEVRVVVPAGERVLKIVDIK